MKYIPNFQELDLLSEKGLLRKVISPCEKLVLYNYTDQCTFERNWNQHTINARGTVYEISTGKIVARAFPKFFNFSELSENKQQEILNSRYFNTYEKLDGSLGIIYFYDGEWRVNTRGSFSSDQAIKGKELLDKLDTSQLFKELTYLVEIIYPENKIIVDYGKEEKLVILAVLDTKTGNEYSIDYGKIFEKPKKYEFRLIEEVIKNIKTLPFSEEGYVVTFNGGERVKFKGTEYLEVARMVSRISPLSIWENMREGVVDRSFLQSLPEEFRELYENITNQLEKNYREIESVHKVIYGMLHNLNLDDKQFASEVNKLENCLTGVLFSMRKMKNYDKIIMREIRPDGNKLNE